MKPLEPLLPGETRPEYLDRLERAEAGNSQQLVARIKRSSKYYGQTEQRGGTSRLRVVGGKITVETKAHKTMTPEEYAAMPIVGWHAVCRNYDGFGGVGVRFMTGGMFAYGEMAND